MGKDIVHIADDDSDTADVYQAVLSNELPADLPIAVYYDGAAASKALLDHDGPTMLDGQMPFLSGPKAIAALAETLYPNQASPFFRAIISGGLPPEQLEVVTRLFKEGHLHVLLKKAATPETIRALGRIILATLADESLLTHFLNIIRNPGNTEALAKVPEAFRDDVFALCVATRLGIDWLKIPDLDLDQNWKAPAAPEEITVEQSGTELLAIYGGTFINCPENLLMVFDLLNEGNQAPNFLAAFFNNFYRRCPGGAARAVPLDHPAETLGELFETIKLPPNEQHSAKLLSQPLRDFYSAIDKAIQSCGLDLDKLEAMVRAAQQDTRLSVELHRALIPVYIALRKKGYTHHDLTY